MDETNPRDAANPVREYSEANIVVLEGHEAIRKRPMMYIGSIDPKGLHVLLAELLDEAVEQMAGGSGRSIAVALHKNGSVTVRDDGPGFPIEEGQFLPALEAVMTKMYAGSSARLGVRLVVVNALSAMVEVEIRRRGFLWRQSFSRGQVVSPLERLGPTRETGTAITFRPDPEIFAETTFEVSQITDRLADLAVLNPEVRFDFRDDRSGQDQSWERRGGLADLVRDLNRGRKTLHEPIAFSGRSGKTEVRFAFQYHDGIETDLLVFANQQRMDQEFPVGKRSFHAFGFLKALRRALGQDSCPWSASDRAFEASPLEVVLPGLTAAVAVRLEQPIFEGCLRERLVNRSAWIVVFSVAYLRLLAHFKDHPELARKIKAKVSQSAPAIES